MSRVADVVIGPCASYQWQIIYVITATPCKYISERFNPSDSMCGSLDVVDEEATVAVKSTIQVDETVS